MHLISFKSTTLYYPQTKMNQKYHYSTMLNDNVHYTLVNVKIHMVRQSNGQKIRHGNLESILVLFQTKKTKQKRIILEYSNYVT